MGHLKTLISFLFVFSSASASVLDEKASYASRRVFWSQAQGPCTVTANLLYSNGYFVREISPAEQQELLEYETNMEEYNKLVADYLRRSFMFPGNWMFESRMFPRLPFQAMPRRPLIPSFCSGRDTVAYRFNGCSVQNYRVYIGPTFVRQLSDEERQELDEFEYKMREYQQGMVSGVRKLSTSWQPGGDYAIPFYHKIYDTENGTSTSPEEVTEVPLITQVYTTQESLTVQPVITYKPKILKPPTPPKICSQMF